VSSEASRQSFRTDLQRLFRTEDGCRRIRFFGYESFVNEYRIRNLEGSVSVLRDSRANRTILIADEAHNLSTQIGEHVNRQTSEITTKGKRAKAFIRYASRCAYVLLLTATPVIGRPKHFLNLWSILHGRTAPIDQMTFQRLLYTPHAFVQSMVGLVVFKDRDLDDADYPRVIYDEAVNMVRVPMSRGFYDVYQQYRDLRLDLRSDADDVVQAAHNAQLQEQEQRSSGRAASQSSATEVIVPLEQLVSRFGHDPRAFLGGLRRFTHAMDDVDNPALVEAVHLIQRHPGKTVLFTPWLRAGVRLLEQLLQDVNIPFVVYEGSTSVEDRETVVRMFNEHPRDQSLVFIVTSAGIEALNLIESKQIILVEGLFSFQREQQIVGRVVRRGSHRHLPTADQEVTIWKLLVVPPDDDDDDDLVVPQRMLEIRLSKQPLVEKFESQLRVATRIAFGGLMRHYHHEEHDIQEEEEQKTTPPRRQPRRRSNHHHHHHHPNTTITPHTMPTSPPPHITVTSSGNRPTTPHLRPTSPPRLPLTPPPSSRRPVTPTPQPQQRVSRIIAVTPPVNTHADYLPPRRTSSRRITPPVQQPTTIGGSSSIRHRSRSRHQRPRIMGISPEQDDDNNVTHTLSPTIRQRRRTRSRSPLATSPPSTAVASTTTQTVLINASFLEAVQRARGNNRV
jgi:hypothetical protein